MSILKGGSLKIVYTFPYLGSNVSSIENDINTRRAKAWTSINRLSKAMDDRDEWRGIVREIRARGTT